MDGFIGRKDLLTRNELAELSRKSDLAGWLQMGSHAGALALSTVLLHRYWGTWWAVPLFAVQGTLLAFLYCAQHELSHSTVFKTRWLNEAFGRLIGFLQLYPRDFDRIQHFAHHRHTGDWEKDAELQRGRYTLGSYLLFFSGVTYWHSRISRLIRLLFGRVSELYVREDEKPIVIREARIHLALYTLIAIASAALDSWAAVQYWLAPLMLFKFTYMLQGILKHLGLPHSDDLLENTRSARTGPFAHWLGWNMQFHTAHHTFPSVPFHQLSRLHRAIVAKTGREPPTMGYLEFQIEVLRKLARRGGEASYSDDETWITSRRNPGAER